jgi:hypothetical protein
MANGSRRSISSVAISSCSPGDAEVWCREAAIVAERFHTRVDVVRVTEHRALGLRASSALLVRPDGIVAWRSKRLDDTSALLHALEQILATSPADHPKPAFMRSPCD